jgi:hypothetical protein
MVNIKCDTIHYHNRMQCNQEAFAIVEIEGMAPHNKCLLHLHTAAAAKQPITKIRTFDPGYQYVADKIMANLVAPPTPIKKEEIKFPAMTVKASSN